VWICDGRSRLEGEAHGMPAMDPGIEPKSVLQRKDLRFSFPDTHARSKARHIFYRLWND
jgi:hypothetical protein